MSLDELFAVVNPWFQTGSLPESDKAGVQGFYAELTGDTGERCRTCPSYWFDVLHTLRMHLRANGYQSMDMTNQEYIIRKDTAYLQVHGLPYVYINRGTGKESDSAKYLTDLIAKQLLKDKPDLSDTIIKNPDYAPEGGKTAKPATAAAKPATARTSRAKAAPAPVRTATETNQPPVVSDAPPVVTDPSTESAPENQAPKE